MEAVCESIRCSVLQILLISYIDPALTNYSRGELRLRLQEFHTDSLF